jgi:small neutral amino acid transporter SnatA (MarC family)
MVNQLVSSAGATFLALFPFTPLPSVESPVGRDISLIPMAVPIVSGPGAIGMMIALAAQNPHWSSYLGSLLGMGLLGVTLYLCLSLGEPLMLSTRC